MLEFSGNFHMQGRALEDPQKLGTQVTNWTKKDIMILQRYRPRQNG